MATTPIPTVWWRPARGGTLSSAPTPAARAGSTGAAVGVAVGQWGHLQLRSPPVGGGDQHRLAIAGGNGAEGRERPDAAQHLGAPRARGHAGGGAGPPPPP